MLKGVVCHVLKFQADPKIILDQTKRFTSDRMQFSARFWAGATNTYSKWPVTLSGLHDL